MESLIGLLVLVVLAVPVLLIAALVSISGLKRRIGSLEVDVAGLRMAPAESPTPAAGAPAPQSAPMQPAPLVAPVFDRDTERPASPFDRPSTATVTGTPSAMPPPAPPMQPPSMRGRTMPPRPSQASAPNAIDIAMRGVRRWFTVGNVPVKIGMLVLLAGVAALLKYASDQGWLRMPVELRLAGIMAAALAALVFGWRQRSDRRAFALAVQGGAIGVLLLTVFAAFKLYALLPAGAAFALSVVLVAGLGVLAVLQDSRTLAVLGILAGFLAPIWLSTGSGNHVALFSYYAVLNAAILVIAWVKPWRVLNLLGFVFTWGIGIAWGVLQYDPSKFPSTEPFLLLFFAFYLAIPILYARRRPVSRRDLIDGCLVFGTPLIAFVLQAGLLRGQLSLAFCALALGVVYAALAAALIRRPGYTVLGQSYALLAIGFPTLAVPLALSARATACVFALEGAALAWLGLRQGRTLPQWTGAGLQVAAGVALLLGGSSDDWSDLRAIANPTFMGAVLIALAGFASAWACRSARKSQTALLYYGWGLLWWCGNAVNEVARFIDAGARADVLLAFAAVSGWLAAEVHRRRPSAALALTTLAGFAIAIPLAFAQMQAHAQPFAGNGSWAWLVYAVLGMRSLVCLRGSDDRFGAWAQFAWWLVWPTTLSLCAWYISDRFALAEGWRMALSILPWLLAAAVSLLRWRWLAAPQGERFDAYRTPLQAVLFAVLGAWWVSALSRAGSAAPLPWLPLLNPLELTQLAVLALAARWLWSVHAPQSIVRLRIAIMAAGGFALVTWITLRAVHHLGGVAWDANLLSTSLAQTSLTVVWSALGVVGWISGSRRGQRGLWLAGAVLMGVVLAKLVLVDRQHLGNLLGIGSFIAYGLLCTLVGYFAPAPPRAASESDAQEMAT